MPKSKIDVSLLTKELTIDGEIATADVVLALMKQMELSKKPDSVSVSYYIKGVGELHFTPEKYLTKEQLDKLRGKGTEMEYPTSH